MIDPVQAQIAVDRAKLAANRRLPDPLDGANCHLCGRTADNFYVDDDLWTEVGLGDIQACFRCFRVAAWYKGIRPDPGWRITT